MSLVEEYRKIGPYTADYIHYLVGVLSDTGKKNLADAFVDTLKEFSQNELEEVVRRCYTPYYRVFADYLTADLADKLPGPLTPNGGIDIYNGMFVAQEGNSFYPSMDESFDYSIEKGFHGIGSSKTMI